MKSLPCLAAFLGLAATSSAATALLNEYNAGGATDVQGDWFEIVVVGGGVAGDVVDMRGWTFTIDEVAPGGEGFAVGRFQLSNNNYWSNVQAGTIVTFHEDRTVDGGRDTSILALNNFATQGWAHTNVWVGDSTFINTTFSQHDPNYPINQNGTQITITRGVTNIFGPAGEGTSTTLGVGDDEVFKLEGTPTPSITPSSPLYNDGTSSTFGAPNRWNANTVVQDFSAFIVPEPGSALMLGAAAVGLLSMRRRRG